MKAYITKTSLFLPNEPVGNDDMESCLGMVDGIPSRARRIVLSRNGIKSRHYALDREGRVTHTNAEMAATVIRNLMGSEIDKVDLLSCGTASPEQVMPSHGIMVHGLLKELGSVEVVSFAGSCCTGVDALKYAMLSVKQGESANAVACASERLSAWMRASYFQSETDLYKNLEKKPMLAFEKEFLRWMLSDGAAAMLVQPNPSAAGLSLRIDWIEKKSYADKVKTCMYAGGDLDADGNLIGWTSYEPSEWLSRSLFALKQDTRMLEKYIVKLGGDFLKSLLEKYDLKLSEVDWFLPHLSSMYFKKKIFDELDEMGLTIPEEKWYVNLPEVGNIASASPYAMIDGLLSSGKLNKGQKILVMVPESARFSFTYCLFTVC